ncbi:hypothetical protein HDU98_004208 [Podochytrium sp. JEL0797]|nr:hypothetical protein HDU98_004208 [Podochytrium sp. JEL0797]
MTSTHDAHLLHHRHHSHPATTVSVGRINAIEIITLGKGTTAVTVSTRGTLFGTASVQHSAKPDSHTAVSVERVLGNKLIVRVEYKEQSYFLPFAVLSFLGFGRLHTHIDIAAPTNLDAFELKGHVATLDYNGPDAHSFKANLDVGQVTIASPLNADHLETDLQVGNISLRDVCVKNGVRLSTGVGEIAATIRGYAFLAAETGVGSIDVELSPHDHNSATMLSTGTGNIVASVFGFKGKFDVNPGLGHVRVVGGNEPFNHYGTGGAKGWVAGKTMVVGNGSGTFGAFSRLGNTNVTFYDRVAPRLEEI